MKQLSLVDGMVYMLDFLGNRLNLMLYYRRENELERKSELISTIANCEFEVYKIETFPEMALNLKADDRHTIKSLRKDPRRNLTYIAKESKVSVRTLRRNSPSSPLPASSIKCPSAISESP